MNRRLTTGRKIIIFIIVFIACFVIYFLTEHKDTIDDDKLSKINNNTTTNSNTVMTESAVITEPVITTDIVEQDELFAKTDILVSEIFVDNENFIDNAPVVTYTGLNKDLYDFTEKATSVIFDGVEIKIGKPLSSVVNNSDYYIHQTDTLSSGETRFLYLYNDKWSETNNKLVSTSKQNGNIILWVKNYGSQDTKVIDCNIYKIQISYLDSYDFYKTRPELSYYDFNLGSSLSAIYSSAEPISSEIIPSTYDRTHRVIYGDIQNCQAVLEIDENKGLIGVTISYNQFLQT